MTDLGNGSVPKGGVLIGQRSMSVTLTRENAEKLKVLANLNGTTPHAMLEFVADQGITIGWNQLIVGKALHVLAYWITWCRF